MTEVPHHEDALLEAIALIAGFGGILVAVGLYVTTPDGVEFAKRALAPIYDILFHKYYVDEIYDFLIVKPVKAIGSFMEAKAEREGIDFAVDQVGEKIVETSSYISLWQSGRVRTYALNMVAGIVVILTFVVFM